MRGPSTTLVDGVELMVEQEAGLGVVRFVVALKAGALSDPAGEAGRLSLAMEMLLRGTQRLERADFHRRLERLGASIDSQVGHDTAWLRGVCLSRFLSEVFALVVEALTAPRMDAPTWAQLKAEAGHLAELERDDDDTVADTFLRRALFAGHALGRPATGDAASIARLDLAGAQRALAALGRGHLLVALVGDIGVEEARQVVAPLAGGMAPSRAPWPPAGPPPLPPGLKVVVVDKPNRTQVQLRVAQLAVDAFHPDVDALWLAVLAFGGTFTSPLTQQVRDERGWSYVAHADMRRRSRYRAPITLRCAPAIADLGDCLALNLELIAQLAEGTLPTGASLEAALGYTLGRYPLEVASAQARLGQTVALRLLGLPTSEVLEMPARWRALDLGATCELLRRNLKGERRVAVLVAPAGQVEPMLRQRFAGAELEVVDYRAAVS